MYMTYYQSLILNDTLIVLFLFERMVSDCQRYHDEWDSLRIDWWCF